MNQPAIKIEAQPDTRRPMVEIRGLNKTYKRGRQEVAVLQGIDLTISEGEFLALMGPSGSGKSTLMNLIAGIDRPTAGSLVVGGTNLAQMDEGQLAQWRRHNVGYIFQTYNLIPVLTAVANVELPLLLHKMSRAERRERAMTALRVVGLADRSQHRPVQLSGGQEQRVAIARAIVADPGVLVADEPTGDLDSRSADEILTLLEALNRDFGKTIVMVTHDPRAAERASLRRVLQKGVLQELKL
jgi:putative ABC transport system ATP-binding protein